MSKQFPHGVVLGKFMPPHHGHKLVIDAALKQSQHVTLIVSVLPNDTIPAEQRVVWLRQLYPTTIVVSMPVTWDVADAQAWADGALAVLDGRHPDAVFSSEEYGHQLATLWYCAHVQIDRDRSIVPISATEIRKNPEKFKHFLDPMVWLFFKS